jgi:hypothetical protein
LHGRSDESDRGDAIADALRPVVAALLEAHDQRVAATRTPRRRRAVSGTADDAVLLELIIGGNLPVDVLQDRVGHSRRTVRAAVKRLERAGIANVDDLRGPVGLDPAFTELVEQTNLQPLRRTVARLTNGDRPRFMKALLILAEETRRT